MVAITTLSHILIFLGTWQTVQAKSSSKKTSAITCTGSKCGEKLQYPFAILDNLILNEQSSITGSLDTSLEDEGSTGFGDLVLKLEVKISNAAWKDESKKLTLGKKHDEV